MSDSQPNSIIALNLPKFVDDEILNAMFKHVNSQISTTEILFIESKNIFSVNNAIITFENNYQAKQVIKKLGNTIQKGVKLYLIMANDQTKQFLISNNKTIYFYTDFTGSESAISAKFQEIGQIEKVNFDTPNKQGFVTFHNSEDALKAKNELDKTKINGFQIEISLFPLSIHRFSKLEGFQFFLDQSEKTNRNLKEGDDKSVFIFDMIENAVNPEFIMQFLEDYNLESYVFGTRLNYDLKKSHYALCTFKTANDAIRAINELNYVKLDDVFVRFVRADNRTRKALATNKGKILILNLRDAQVSEVHDSFFQFGEVVECEIPIDENGEFRKYGYVQFYNEEDAEKAITELNGALINGNEVEILKVEETDSNDPEKEFLYEKKVDIDPIICVKSSKLTSEDLFNHNLSMFINNDDYFSILIKDEKIDCYRLVAIFLSPIIACKIKNDSKMCQFKIEIEQLDQMSANNYELISFISSFLVKYPSKRKLKKLFAQMTKQIISFTIENKISENLQKIVNKCTDYLLGKMTTKKSNNDCILNLIVLVDILAQFGNDFIIQYIFSLILNNVKEDTTIKDEQTLFIRLQIKSIMRCSFNFNEEINFICENFFDIDPFILNSTDLNILTKAVKKLYISLKDQDSFLYKLMRFDDNYKKKLIDFVDFKLISQKVMKEFLASIDLSFIDENILARLSTRLGLPIREINEIESDQPNLYAEIILRGFQSIDLIGMYIDDKDFLIFVNDRMIEVSKFILFSISPTIQKNLRADITISSFAVDLDLQMNHFKEFLKSFSYFINQKPILDIDQEIIVNRFFEQFAQFFEIIDQKGFNEFHKFIQQFPSTENDPLNCAVCIWIFLNLGNYKTAEFLINSIVRMNDNIQNDEQLFERFHHKEILKLEDKIKVNLSAEINFINEKYYKIISKVKSFQEINENIWKVISIRLSNEIYCTTNLQ